LSSNLTSIGEYAFKGCASLPELSVPNSVSEIGVHAFDACTSLATINVPTSLKLILEYAFARTAINEITIPASVDSVGAAFYGCSKLKKVTINDSEKEIKMAGSYDNDWCMFSNYYNGISLKEVYVGRDMKVSGGSPFRNDSIQTLTLGNMVSNIINEDYTYCKGVKELYCYATNPPVCEDAIVFRDINKTTCTLYVPESSLNAYKEAEVWKDFLNMVPIMGEPVHVPEDVNNDGVVDSQDVLRIYQYMRSH